MPAGTVLLTELCKYKNPDNIIEIVKLYINGRGIFNGYCTEFTNDFSAVRKWDILLRTPSEKLKESI